MKEIAISIKDKLMVLLGYSVWERYASQAFNSTIVTYCASMQYSEFIETVQEGIGAIKSAGMYRPTKPSIDDVEKAIERGEAESWHKRIREASNQFRETNL